MSHRPLATVVIPVWRDTPLLRDTLNALPPHPGVEVVVATVLGDNADLDELRSNRPDVRWIAGPRGRAVQMNAGASLAGGHWLVFLHADSRLPADWMDVLRSVDVLPDVVGGSFRFALESRDWRARVIEWGVRARVALFGLPYGDQAIFVRHDVFAAMNGYRDWPLMEDVDFVRRLQTMGRLWHSSSRVLTSARRWEREGWTRRSAGNVALTFRFLLGDSPSQLAQRYHQRPAKAVVVMARAPWTPGKTRLVADLGDLAGGSLREALFRDTLDVVRSVAGVAHIVACEPPEAVHALQAQVGAAADVVPQRGSDLGARLVNAFDDTFRLGADSVVVIGSDLPDLPPRLITEAFDALRADRAVVVVGPANDGGYYLIGMTRPNPGLFAEIDWGTGQVLAQTCRIATRLGVQIVQLDPWRDVDAPADLERLRREPVGDDAVRTRQWLSSRGDDPVPPTG